MDSTDWHFYTLERRGTATAPLTEIMWSAAEYGARSTCEAMPMTPSERGLLHQLFAVVIDRQTWQKGGHLLHSLGELGTELRHAVDLAQLYSADLHRHAYATARGAYQAAVDVLPAGADEPGRQ